MGNHDVGRAFAAAFEALEPFSKEMTQEQILEALDKVGNKYKNADAEFDDYLYDDHPLAKAVQAAFAPDLGPYPDSGSEEEKTRWEDRYYDEVITPFRKRYGFC